MTAGHNRLENLPGRCCNALSRFMWLNTRFSEKTATAASRAMPLTQPIRAQAQGQHQLGRQAETIGASPPTMCVKGLQASEGLVAALAMADPPGRTRPDGPAVAASHTSHVWIRVDGREAVLG